MNRKRTEQYLKYAAFAVVIVIALLQIWAQRGLFADGSFQLLNFLRVEGEGQYSDQGFFTRLFHEFVTSNNEPTRLFTYLFIEFPTVAALRLGVTNIHALIYIFSGWLTLSPLLFWSGALWKLREDFLFWPFLLIFSVIYFNGNFFSIGEYNLAYSLSAFCLALLLREKPNKTADYVLLGCAAFITIMSYASTLFLGALLSALATRKYREAPKNMKPYWAFIITLFGASVGVGIWSYCHPGNLENFQNARNIYSLLDNTQFWMTMTFAALATLQLFVRHKDWLRAATLALVGFALVVLFGEVQGPPYTGYSVRAFMGLTLFGLSLGLVWLRFYAKKFANVDVRYFAAPVFVLFLSLSLLDMQNSIGFRHFLDNYKKTVDARTGFVRFEDTIAWIPNCSRYGWGWTYPSLGLLLRKNTTAAVIIDPAYQKGRWAPFTSSNVPDLSRYYVE